MWSRYRTIRYSGEVISNTVVIRVNIKGPFSFGPWLRLICQHSSFGTAWSKSWSSTVPIMRLTITAVLLLQTIVTAHPHLHEVSESYSNLKVVVSRAYDANDPYANWPTYGELPLNSSFPTKAAWGVWVTEFFDIFEHRSWWVIFREQMMSMGH